MTSRSARTARPATARDIDMRDLDYAATLAGLALVLFAFAYFATHLAAAIIR